jgi:hypothetical protein
MQTQLPNIIAPTIPTVMIIIPAFTLPLLVFILMQTMMVMVLVALLMAFGK